MGASLHFSSYNIHAATHRISGVFLERNHAGKVEDAEIKTCKDKVYSIDHLKIKYPELAPLVVCSVPKLYPTTGEYKKAEFAPLPVVAKGKLCVNSWGELASNSVV